MAVLVGGQTWGLQGSQNRNKSVVLVKLTDASLRALEEYVRTEVGTRFPGPAGSSGASGGRKYGRTGGPYVALEYRRARPLPTLADLWGRLGLVPGDGRARAKPGRDPGHRQLSFKALFLFHLFLLLPLCRATFLLLAGFAAFAGADFGIFHLFHLK